MYVFFFIFFQDYFVCFMFGIMVLGYQNGLLKDYMEIVIRLIRICYEMYNKMFIKFSLEIVYFN